MLARRSTAGVRIAAIPAALGLAAVGCRSAGPPSSGDKFPVHGSLQTRYQGRWTEGAHDNDVTEVVSLELGDKKKDPVTGFVMAEGLADLDGRGGGSTGVFHSLADTYDGAVTGRLFYA